MTEADVIRLATLADYPLLEFDGKTHIHAALLRMLKIAVSEEREECAKVCEDAAFDWHLHASGGPVAHYNHSASAIRARGHQ